MSEKCEAKEKTDAKTSFGYGQPFILFLPLVRNSGLRASKVHITQGVPCIQEAGCLNSLTHL